MLESTLRKSYGCSVIMSLLLLILACLIETKEISNSHKTNKKFTGKLTFKADFDDETFLSFEEIVKHRGLPFEKYNVTTDDGYILTIFRIPRKSNKVALLWHGIVDSADAWIMAGKNESIPWNLYENGYDVWFGNTRGNKYSRAHIRLNPDKDSAEFFSYTFHETGTIDVPNVIDFILKTTQVAKLTYISHSQGSTAIYCGMAMKPDYFARVLNGVVTLAPVLQLQNAANVLKFLIYTKVDSLVSTLGIDEMLTSKDDKVLAYLCKVLKFACQGVVGLFADDSSSDYNYQKFVNFVAHYPSGASVKSFKHFAGIYRNKDFVQFDYGSVENLKKYYSPYPPKYKLENIKVPSCVLIGEADKVSTLEDSDFIKNELNKSGSLSFFKTYKRTGHMTFLVPLTNEIAMDVLACSNSFLK